MKKKFRNHSHSSQSANFKEQISFPQKRAVQWLVMEFQFKWCKDMSQHFDIKGCLENKDLVLEKETNVLK